MESADLGVKNEKEALALGSKQTCARLLLLDIPYGLWV